ncbi:LysR substrate-binding domain-containing protein [Paenarthrobacter sp. JL.01a]|uniref:LysR substrate-binding domain-containing protein n=1 Tax=Paenarthrobacter sp. JL.01a TaxID=2979324 RepID=UPI0021C89479|nr:LysR substrate-binding domain-containing protein [Paenarthrobacter sp. JL.01a]UXM91595.1 LysR substrate-binding domain-containing protein [Paenarthrobacter sp. JL.01a]
MSARDEIILVLPRDRAAPEPGTPVKLAGYAHESWLLDQEGSVFERLVLQTCQEAGFTPKVI